MTPPKGRTSTSLVSESSASRRSGSGSIFASAASHRRSGSETSMASGPDYTESGPELENAIGNKNWSLVRKYAAQGYGLARKNLLHKAIRHGAPVEIVELLVEKGCEIDELQEVSPPKAIIARETLKLTLYF